MLVIKINTFEYVTKDGDNVSERKLKDTFFIEGEDLHVRALYHHTHNDEKYTKDSFPDFVEAVLIKELDIGESWHVNASDNSQAFLLIGYFNPAGVYKNAVIYDSATVYLLQNGKTIDKYTI